MVEKIRSAMSRAHGLDLALSQRTCEAVASRVVVAFLRGLSRFGDGALSLTAAVVLLLGRGPAAAARFAGVALAGVAIQKTLKALLSRRRPCFVDGGPSQRAPIPDAGSFPSGHTLHAVLAAVTVAAFVPMLAPPFFAVAALMAWSRVALGVHYPSDVLAGGALGGLLGALACLR